MNKKAMSPVKRDLVFLFVLIIILSAILPIVSAEGCCCNTQTGRAEPDSAQPDVNSCASDLTFLELSVQERFAQVTCTDKCVEEFGLKDAVCGDGVCEAERGETVNNCPADCKPVIAKCGEESYNPAPMLFNALPVKGTNMLELSFTLECPQSMQFLDIYRCKGRDCSDFKKIDTIAPSTSYKDISGLEFNQDYAYKIEVQYSKEKSNPANAVGNIGDIECLNQYSTTFCLSEGYYTRYKQQLQESGYGLISAKSFQDEFNNAVRASFNTKFNKAWKCNEINRLYQDLPKVQCDSAQDQVCVVRAGQAKCALPDKCESSRPFGLLDTINSCEGDSQNAKYCYFDRTETIINKCKNCPTDSSLRCYDYKTKGACERDNCNVGNCAWRDIVESLGIGVCIDAVQSNCQYCSENTGLFDVCSPTKAKALSTTKAACYYSPTRSTALDCSKITCQDYELEQDCGAPSAGIRLNPDNSIKQKSTDPCGIGVCEFRTNGCMKNADGNTGPGSEDCAKGDLMCERDYFPPETSISFTGEKNEFVHVRIKDKKSKEDPLRDFSGKKGYETYLCLATPAEECNDYNRFTIKTNSSRLIINNLVLFEQTRKIANLREGSNTIKFYSKDDAKNTEQIKSVEVFACDNCQGPSLDLIKVEDANNVDDFFYTNNIQPTIRAEFVAPTQITKSELIQYGRTIHVDKLSGSSFDTTFLFKPSIPLSEGSYTFKVKGVNQKTVLEKEFAVGIIIDTTAPTVEITPKSGTEFEEKKAFVKIEFSEPILSEGLILEEDTFVNKFASVPETTKISEILKAKDAKLFEGTINHAADGVISIIVDVTDLAGNKLKTISTYSIITGLGKIRLKQPNWGISSESSFDIIVQTTTKAECSYAFNLPAKPAANEQNFLAGKRFAKTGGNFHTVFGFDRVKEKDRENYIDVFCKDRFGVMHERFPLSLDKTNPFITEAFAAPEIISESSDPIKEIYETTLSVVLNEEGFCRYSPELNEFKDMLNFPSFDRVPKPVLQAPIHVKEQKIYQYFIQCKDKADLLSNIKTVEFSVDLKKNFSIESKTKPGFNSTEIELKVFTNKKSICFYGKDERSITNEMEGEIGFFHTKKVVATTSTGIATFYTRCTSTEGETAETKIDVFIDSTLPSITIDVSTDYYLNRSISWDLDQFKIRLEGDDKESGIAGFYYLIESNNGTFVDWTFIDKTDGKPFYSKQKEDGTNIQLTNGTLYRVRARAVNKAGLYSEEKTSTDVLIDISVEPEHCKNERRDSDEGEIGRDCGGTCGGTCAVGDSCLTNENCESGICKDAVTPDFNNDLKIVKSGEHTKELAQTATNVLWYVCKAPNCEDGVKSFGFETGIDCGGECSAKCALEVSCKTGNDCISGFCENFVCKIPGPCEDGRLAKDGSETDVDCGGICRACEAEKNCRVNNDCKKGLVCDDGACIILESADSDNDGIKDSEDMCLETKEGIPVSKIGPYAGCSDDQRCSQFIINSFGSKDVEGAGEQDDPDEDRLTNIEECFVHQKYSQSTDPLIFDTDGDGWDDGTEFKKGYNPLSEKEHPPYFIWTLLKWISILALLGGIGYGGYHSYQKWIKQWLEENKLLKKKPIPPPLIERKEIYAPQKRPQLIIPKKLRKKPENAFKELKRFAQQEKEYLTLEELAKKTKKKEESKKVFEKLKKLKAGEIPAKKKNDKKE